MNDDIEQELLTKALCGDPSAAPFLVSYFGESLLGYARIQAPNLSDPDRERIVELAIEAGVRAIAKFDPTRGSLKGWFRGQIRFQTLGWLRKHPQLVALDDQPETPADTTSPPSARVDALRRAMRQLSTDDQVVLALRNTERLGFNHIASRLDVSEATARQRHKRALDRLRKAVSDEPELQHLKEGN